MCEIVVCVLLKGRRTLDNSCLTYCWHALQHIKSLFFYSGVDYLGPPSFAEARRNKKAWGLMFTCMASRAIHVELVTSLSLNDFLLAFTRFSDLRGQVNTIYLDNVSTFWAGSKKLPELIETKDFHIFLRRKGIN